VQRQMAGWRKGVWRKRSRRLTGTWYYDWAADEFIVHLNSRDPITGRTRKVRVRGEHPDFNGWRLVRDNGGRS